MLLARPSPPPAMDPREGDPRFRKLPKEMQAEVRREWEASAKQDRWIERVRRAEHRRSLVEAVVLIGATEAWMKGFSPAHVALGLALGAIVGEIWWRVRAGQIATPLVAALGYLALQFGELAFDFGQRSALLFGSAFVAFTSAYLGVRREQRAIE